MVNEEIVGTEIDCNWNLNAESDLSLVRGSDNLSQAIFLRLSAYFDSLSWAYDFYGSYVKDWLGKNQNVYTRTTLLDEIKKRVILDPRVEDAEINIEDWNESMSPERKHCMIGISIIAKIVDGTTFQEYYIFSDLPRKNENVNSPNWSNTWIETRDEGYFSKIGEFITVHCYVRDELNMKVPIGEVALTIGGYHVDIQNNPQEVGQSHSRDPGGCTFKFRIPPIIKKGTHKLRFTYKGIKGYNNCYAETNLHIVDKLPTSMEYIYPKPNETWYYANDVDYFTDPVVHVKDVNEYDVLHGQVRYYISNYLEDGEFVFLEFPIIFHGSVLLQETIYMYCNAQVLDYSLKFIFRTDYMFRPLDIFTLRAQDGTIIDYLECSYSEGVFFLTSTKYTKPYEFITSDGKRINVKRNDDIDTMRFPNTDITMEVVE